MDLYLLTEKTQREVNDASYDFHYCGIKPLHCIVNGGPMAAQTGGDAPDGSLHALAKAARQAAVGYRANGGVGHPFVRFEEDAAASKVYAVFHICKSPAEAFEMSRAGFVFARVGGVHKYSPSEEQTDG